MTTPRGDRTLLRPFTGQSSPLRAWSAADELVLDHLAQTDLGRTLIVNDEFGALTCGLATSDVTVWTDSSLSRGAIDANLEANGFTRLEPHQSTSGDALPNGPFETVIVRVPKSTALLDYQLDLVASVSSPDTTIVGTGMVRHIHRSTVAAFEHIGETTTSRATRKARLLFTVATGAAPQPADLPTAEFTIESGIHVVEHPGTFSVGHIDVGSALLLEVMADQPAPQAGAVIADLGCGNGVLIASLARQWATNELTVVAIDTSDLAVAAAAATWRRNGLGGNFRAVAADGFTATHDDTFDVVVSNPPFHQGHAIDSGLTDRLLADTARVLRPDGVAYIVVQRHLQLHTRMRRWFSLVEVASKHPSHVVLIARHPR